MAVLPILRWPDTRLKTICEPVNAGEDIGDLIADLFDTMYAAPGRGLAAPQVGVMKRLFVIDVSWKEAEPSPMVFVNPRIIETSERKSDAEEACLSIPGITTTINRPDWVVMVWTDAQGQEQAQRFDGTWARCAQHELDHLNGIVTLQHLDAPTRKAAESRYAVQP
ncbi:peptide deformylase [Sedimentitalea todarodis]|uniref:Peptide deformylase n=1 Tax=Sedimentitalea todarodis TaxID=1631240 RepID=A0ABU3V9G1_9RHOB|nr:peptide deformylase [Sedimentitalea todarodis]MDU9002811.1 peptide deformylase [Sedimentitalea todarodis]